MIMPQSSFELAHQSGSQPSFAQNTILVVSRSDFGGSLSGTLTKLGAEVIRCSSRQGAQRLSNERHIDAIVTEEYLGRNDPNGGAQLARWSNGKRLKSGSVEYPIVVIVAAWSPSFEERVLNLGAVLAEYNYHDILRRLSTALWMARSATERLPSYEITFQNPTRTDRPQRGSLITSITTCWGGRRLNITPPSAEGLLLLVYLVTRLNHPSNIDAIVEVHNYVEFYYAYLGTAHHCTYDSMKVRYSKLKHFLNKKLGKSKAERILQSVSLEDDKSRAYVLKGSSFSFKCEVVAKKNRT